MMKSKHISTQEIIDIADRSGSLFELSVDFTLASGASLETVVTTGSKPVIVFSRAVSFDGDGLNAYIKRGGTFTGGSEDIEVNNPNDINPQSPESVILSGATVNEDWIQSRAPKYIFGNTSNQGGGGTLQLIDSDEPQLILPNTSVLFIIENRQSSNQEIASHVKWVEVDNIPGIIIQNDAFVAYNGVKL